MQSLKRIKAITGQKQGNHTIHTVFFITVRTVMTLLTFCNEENRTNRVVSLLLARNSFDPFETLHHSKLFTFEAQVNSFVLKFLGSRSTFTAAAQVFNCHDPSKKFYLEYGSI